MGAPPVFLRTSSEGDDSSAASSCVVLSWTCWARVNSNTQQLTSASLARY